MHIRLFSDQDAGKTAELIRRTVSISNGKDYSQEILQSLINFYSPEKISSLNKTRVCLVAEKIFEHEKRIVGTVALEGNCILMFFVLPEFQGLGIGRRLLLEIEKLAFGRGIKRLTLDSSITAVPFYVKMNYRIIKSVKGASGDVVEMEKDLESL